MIRYPLFTLLISLLLAPTAIAMTVPAATAEAKQLVQSLSLREGGPALRDHPRWQRPAYIVAYIPAQMKPLATPMIAALTSVAGEIPIRSYSPTGSGELPDFVRRAEVVFGPCNKALLDQIPQLIWIQIPTSGSEACTSQSGVSAGDLLLTNAQRMAAVPIAEHAIGLTLMLSKNLHRYHRSQVAGKWQRQLGLTSGELGDKTMLVLGLGGIGSEVAKRANALGMRVIATRNSSRSGPDYVDQVGLASDMLDLAKEADIIVNALPLTPATLNLIDSEFFTVLKPGTLYVSVGRGQTTDLEDLMIALDNGQLAGAALDVMHPEPLPANHPLWSHDKVIITPHVAGFSGAAFNRTFILFKENLRRYLNGDRLLNVVDIERGY